MTDVDTYLGAATGLLAVGVTAGIAAKALEALKIRGPVKHAKGGKINKWW